MSSQKSEIIKASIDNKLKRSDSLLLDLTFTRIGVRPIKIEDSSEDCTYWVRGIRNRYLDEDNINSALTSAITAGKDYNIALPEFYVKRINQRDFLIAAEHIEGNELSEAPCLDPQYYSKIMWRIIDFGNKITEVANGLSDYDSSTDKNAEKIVSLVDIKFTRNYTLPSDQKFNLEPKIILHDIGYIRAFAGEFR